MTKYIIFYENTSWTTISSDLFALQIEFWNNSEKLPTFPNNFKGKATKPSLQNSLAIPEVFSFLEKVSSWNLKLKRFSRKIQRGYIFKWNFMAVSIIFVILWAADYYDEMNGRGSKKDCFKHPNLEQIPGELGMWLLLSFKLKF